MLGINRAQVGGGGRWEDVGGDSSLCKCPWGPPSFHASGVICSLGSRWSTEGRGKETQILQADSPRCVTRASHRAALVENGSLQ